MAKESWGFYLGKWNNVPVAASCAKFCVNEFADANQVLGIFLVAVTIDARNKGFGNQITFVPLLEGKQKGYQFAVLYATSMGYPVYLQLGFKDYFKFPCYGN